MFLHSLECGSYVCVHSERVNISDNLRDCHAGVWSLEWCAVHAVLVCRSSPALSRALTLVRMLACVFTVVYVPSIVQ